ncbi:hypothetical protein ILYODFUR_029812 [Ilyodon furcidens]|uniref:Secreted protein n=1 Tax=Ilyodon furcidens TaxID=33524 RepID=A0ABV0UP09_9TELE
MSWGSSFVWCWRLQSLTGLSKAGHLGERQLADYSPAGHSLLQVEGSIVHPSLNPLFPSVHPFMTFLARRHRKPVLAHIIAQLQTTCLIRFSGWSNKEKTSSEWQLCGGKYLVDLRGQMTELFRMIK